MTDRETLFAYRFNQAEETLTDAHKMLEAGIALLSPGSLPPTSSSRFILSAR